ncbi:MAG: hypothetical protein DBP01_02840 [gamma proteobacterium symbiont of Ctena orbiculata]|nr:MAG: hypothetical protein DBP01_02840 [gamma proteobacterium symbiont of Ctena orbiculata]
MNKLIVILFAVLDSNIWGSEQLVCWVDEVISKLERPKAWLAELSISDSIDNSLEVVREAMRSYGVLLPENIGDLIIGFILIRFDKSEITEEVARTCIIDVVDAYGSDCVDVETAVILDLNDKIYLTNRRNAKLAIDYLTSEKLFEVERELLED